MTYRERGGLLVPDTAAERLRAATIAYHDGRRDQVAGRVDVERISTDPAYEAGVVDGRDGNPAGLREEENR